ncbi:MAG: substrate-binding domain-containing protein [Anaerolineales bacterium]|nr:substrate-binding domain-containing protein [Anaerolineales bacterium]
MPIKLLSRTFFLLGIGLLLAACISDSPTPETSLLYVQHTFAVHPWLEAVQSCAGERPVIFEQRAANFLNPDETVAFAIRIGEPTPLLFLAYDIAREDVVVILHPDNPTHALTREQVRALFSGSITNWKEVGGTDAPVHVWIFPPGEDVQQVFTTALEGIRITTFARLAAKPETMLQAIAEDPHAIGLITRRLLDKRVRATFTIVSAPVLLMTSTESPAAELAGCLRE